MSATSALADELAWIGRELESARAEEAKHLAPAARTLEIAQREAEEAITEAERSLTAGQNERDAVTERFSALRTETHRSARAVARRARRPRAAPPACATRLGSGWRKTRRPKSELAAQIEALGAQQREAAGGVAAPARGLRAQHAASWRARKTAARRCWSRLPPRWKHKSRGAS